MDGATWFLLVAYSEMREKGNKLEEELPSQNRTAHNDFKNSQLIQMACYLDKIRV